MFSKRRFCAVLAAGVGLALLAGCQKPKSVAEAFVAQVGEATITAAEWTREVQKHPNLTAEQRENGLQELIRTEALVAKARESGFDRDPEVQQRVKRLIATAYLERLQGPEGGKSNTVAELKEYYAAHAKEFGVGERIHVAGILLRVPQKATDEKKKEYEERATGILAKAVATQTSGATFGELAREVSEDQSTRYQGGDMGWLTRAEAESRWSKEIADVLFGLKQPRELSPVVAVPGGWSVFKLIERQGERVKTLDEVKNLVSFRVGREKEGKAKRELDEKVKAGLKIEINRALVDQIASANANAPSAPPGMPAP